MHVQRLVYYKTHCHVERNDENGKLEAFSVHVSGEVFGQNNVKISTDTEWAIESVRIKPVQFRENVRAYFPQGQGILSINNEVVGVGKAGYDCKLILGLCRKLTCLWGSRN